MDVIEEEKLETVPAELPTEAAPEPSDDLDRLLQEYQAATDKPVEAVSDQEAPADLDQQLQDLLGPDPKVAELQGQLNDLRTRVRAAEELKAFNEFAGDLQKQLPSWVPEDYARVKLESLAHDPVARLAWETRHIDPKAASLDLAHVQHALMRLQADPNADPAKVQELNRLGYQLSVAANSASILRQARNQIIKEANALKPPIDPEATADRDAIAQAIREGQGPINIPEAPPNFATMSDREFKDFTRRHYGF